MLVAIKLFTRILPVQVRRGDNISFLYASVLPKLFEQPPSHEVIVDFNSKKLTK